jgi:thioredoxin-related protein
MRNPKLNLIAFITTAVLLFPAGKLFAGNVDTIKAESEVHWISFPELEKNMKEHPKKIIVDVYTPWCGWCKTMDKKTYSNPRVIQYINENFYAVKFNAEQKESVNFIGQDWEYLPQQKVNRLALELLQNRMSYPTTVIMGEDMKSVNPIPGYLEVPQLEMILKYIVGNNEQTVSWADWQKKFKPEWQ